MNIQEVGVLGCGLMGSGITQVGKLRPGLPWW
jgi:3-hydroxyacyl-CoA dehydrogenase